MTPDPASPAPALTPADWERLLAERLPGPVTVSYGRSRTTPLLAHPPRRATPAWRVRMHSVFAAAPVEVRAAVVDLLGTGRKRRQSRAILDAWIQRALASHPPPRIPDERLATKGLHHDLARIAAGLLASECRGDFGAARAAPRITWGRSRKRRGGRGIRLGSYDVESHLVRIHPALDQPAVPEWFVRYVVFHELLHAVHPPVRGGDGRWIRHGKEFGRRERGYPGLERALAWEREHIDRLIRSARTGRPMRPVRPMRSTRSAPAVGEGAARAAVRFLQGLLFPEEPSASRTAPRCRPRSRP